LAIAGLTVAYYQQKVHPPVDAAYGLYIGAVATAIAAICSVWALLSAWSSEQSSGQPPR